MPRAFIPNDGKVIWAVEALPSSRLIAEAVYDLTAILFENEAENMFWLVRVELSSFPRAKKNPMLVALATVATGT